MYCNYCAKELEETNSFCSEEHEEKFAEAKKNNISVPLQIKTGLVVFCKKYDKIQSIIEKYLQKPEYVDISSLTKYAKPKLTKKESEDESDSDPF